MDLDRIFNLFNNENSSSDDESSLLVDFSEHPLYWIGGFNKIISNHLFFKNYTVNINKLPRNLQTIFVSQIKLEQIQELIKNYNHRKKTECWNLMCSRKCNLLVDQIDFINILNYVFCLPSQALQHTSK